MPDPSDRMRRHRARREAAGYAMLSVWVPADQIEELRAYLARAVREFERENPLARPRDMCNKGTRARDAR